MTPQELKNSILQLAIQGKLVEQRPEEGTAEELYQQIQAEKQALIKAGKLKKEKLLPEITEEEKPFEIPESWKWVHLNQIAESGLGKTLDKAKNTGALVPYLCSINVYWTGISLEKVKEAKFSDDERIKYRLQKGDLLICEGGDVGRCAIWNSNEEMYYQNALHRVRFYSQLFPQYFQMVIQCYKGIGIIDEFSKGMTIKHLVQNSLYAMWLPLPPLAEQNRIVAKIEELLPLIDRYEQAWNRLEDFNKRFPMDLQKSILQLAIQGKLVPQRHEEGTGEELYQQIQAKKQALIKSGELRRTKALPLIAEDDYPYDIPESWKVCYIDDIAFVTKLAGFEYTEHIAPNLVPEGIPLFKGKNVQNGQLVLKFESFIPEKISDDLPRSQIRKKCLLTPYVGTIGNIAIFDGSFRAHLGSNVGKIELLNGEKLHVLEEYVLYYLRSQIGYAELTKFKKATAQESISIDAIRNVIIPLPPVSEQKRIVTKLQTILPICEAIN